MNETNKQTQKLCACDDKLCACQHNPSTYEAYKQSLKRTGAGMSVLLLIWLAAMTSLILVILRINR